MVTLVIKKNGGVKILNQKVLEYVDDVVLIIPASKEFKMKLENELIRHIIFAAENISIEQIINKLGSPKLIADKMSLCLLSEIREKMDRIFIEVNDLNMKMGKAQEAEISIAENHECDGHNNYGCNNHRRPGEYVREDNNVNIKLLYIPLIQICSQMERISLPYVEDSFFE